MLMGWAWQGDQRRRETRGGDEKAEGVALAGKESVLLLAPTPV
jgi:hypothetical protein